jgi:hypothetical protein
MSKKKNNKKMDFDQASSILLEEFSEYKADFLPEINELKGSISQKNILKINEIIKPLNKPYYGIERDSKSIFAILEKGRRLGFENKSYENFIKFINAVFESYKDKISLNFTREYSFEWIIRSRLSIEKTARIEIDFISFFETKISENLKDYEISFKILNLDIQKDFKIGNVNFWFVPKNFWSDQINTNENNQLLDDEFSGKVFVGCTVKGYEKEKAKQEAYELCCYAVDVLKTMISSTIDPHEPIYFEIDNRCKYQPHGVGLIKELNSKSPTINMNSNIRNCILDNDFINWILDPERELLSNTVLCFYSEINELKQLCIESIKRFSDAVSSPKVYSKIVSLITIWESLLLPNENSPIKHTLLKYGPKLIFDHIEDRRKLEVLINKYYKIRSDYLHHSKENNVNEIETREIQNHTLSLIIVLLHASEKFQTKNDLLKTIDLELEKAFRLSHVLNLSK